MTIKINSPYGADTTMFQQNGVGAVIRNGLYKQREIVSVTDFGAKGDGITNDTISIQRAFDALPEGGTLYFPVGTYLITSTITCSKAFTVYAYGASFFVNANVTAFIFTANVVEVSPLTANYVLGAKTLFVSGLTTALKKGQPFKVISNAVDPANRDNGASTKHYRISEWATAGEGSTITNIVLTQPLRFSKGIDPISIDGDEDYVDCFTTDYHAKVLVTSSKKMCFYGGTIYYPDGNDDTWKGKCLSIVGYYTPIIKDVVITRGYAQGIVVAGCYKPIIEACNVSNLNDNTSKGQYGYAVDDVSYMTSVSNCKFSNVRHHYTTGGATIEVDSTLYNNWLWTGQVYGGVVSNCSASGHGTFDTHHGARNITFDNCIVDGSDSWAYTSRGVGITFNNCRALNCKYGMFIYTEYESGDSEDDLWVSGKPWGCSTARVINPYLDVETRPLYFSQMRHIELIGGKVKATNQRLIENNGSNLIVDGSIDFEVTNHDGTRVYTELNDYGIFNASATSGTLAPSADWIARTVFTSGAEVRVNAKNAINTGSTMSVFKDTSGTPTVVNGRITLILSDDFNKFIDGAASSYVGAEHSEIRVEVDGAADNSLDYVYLLGSKLRVTTADETGFYDGTGYKKRSEKLSSYSTDAVAIPGTGLLIEPAYAPEFICGKFLNEAGHCLRYSFRISKSNSIGAAIIGVDLQTSYVTNIPIAATDSNCKVDIWVNTLNVNSQRIVVKASSSSPGSSLVTPASEFLTTTNEVTPLTSTVSCIRFNVTAAVGDTITFQEMAIYSDMVGYGFA